MLTTLKRLDKILIEYSHKDGKPMMKLVFRGQVDYESEKSTNLLPISKFTIEVSDDGKPIVTVNGVKKDIDEASFLEVMKVLADNQ